MQIYAPPQPPRPPVHNFGFSASRLPIPSVIRSLAGSVTLPAHLENAAIAAVIVSQRLVITVGITRPAPPPTKRRSPKLQQPSISRLPFQNL